MTHVRTNGCELPAEGAPSPRRKPPNDGSAAPHGRAQTLTILERIQAFAYGAFWAGLLSTLIGAIIIALAHDWGFVPYGVGETAGLTSSVITGAIIGGIYFLWSAVKRAQLAQEIEELKKELREEIARLREPP